MEQSVIDPQVLAFLRIRDTVYEVLVRLKRGQVAPRTQHPKLRPMTLS